MSELEALERRVGEKFVAVAAARTPNLPLFDMEIDWWSGSPPSDVPQFPRERWVSYPNRRTVTLTLIDRVLDLDLDDPQWVQVCWLWQYGGKVRL